MRDARRLSFGLGQLFETRKQVLQIRILKLFLAKRIGLVVRFERCNDALQRCAGAALRSLGRCMPYDCSLLRAL